MLGLFFVLLITFLVLLVFLWVGTLWFQGYIYSEPVSDLSWRAPAAAGALTLVLALWCFLAMREWGGEGTLFDFGPTDNKEFDRFTAVYGRVVPLTSEPVKPDVKLTDRLVLKSPREVPYARRRVDRFHSEYSDPNGKAWARSDSNGLCAQLRFKQGDQELLFQPELEIVKDGSGKDTVQFKYGKVAQLGGTETQQPLRYLEVGGRGRVMTVDNLGWLAEFRWGPFLVNLLLNVLHLAVWFVCLWLLLRFQWSHALGLAFIFWLVMTLAVLPPILNSARAAAQSSLAPGKTASAGGSPAVTAEAQPACWAVRKPFQGSRVSGVQWTLRVQDSTS